MKLHNFKVGQKVIIKCLDKYSVSIMKKTVGQIGEVRSQNDNHVIIVYFKQFDRCYTYLYTSITPAKLKIG